MNLNRISLIISDLLTSFKLSLSSLIRLTVEALSWIVVPNFLVPEIYSTYFHFAYAISGSFLISLSFYWVLLKTVLIDLFNNFFFIYG